MAKKYPIESGSEKVFAKEIVINEAKELDNNYYNQKAIDFLNNPNYQLK